MYNVSALAAHSPYRISTASNLCASHPNSRIRPDGLVDCPSIVRCCTVSNDAIFSAAAVAGPPLPSMWQYLRPAQGFLSIAERERQKLPTEFVGSHLRFMDSLSGCLSAASGAQATMGPLATQSVFDFCRQPETTLEAVLEATVDPANASVGLYVAADQHFFPLLPQMKALQRFKAHWYRQQPTGAWSMVVDMWVLSRAEVCEVLECFLNAPRTFPLLLVPSPKGRCTHCAAGAVPRLPLMLTERAVVFRCLAHQ